MLPLGGPTPASMDGFIAFPSEASLLLLVPASKHKTRFKCAKNRLRYPYVIHRFQYPGRESAADANVSGCAMARNLPRIAPLAVRSRAALWRPIWNIRAAKPTHFCPAQPANAGSRAILDFASKISGVVTASASMSLIFNLPRNKDDNDCHQQSRQTADNADTANAPIQRQEKTAHDGC